MSKKKKDIILIVVLSIVACLIIGLLTFFLIYGAKDRNSSIYWCEQEITYCEFDDRPEIIGYESIIIKKSENIQEQINDACENQGFKVNEDIIRVTVFYTEDNYSTVDCKTYLCFCCYSKSIIYKGILKSEIIDLDYEEIDM